MSFDAFTIRKLCADMNVRLADSRVDKISQPEKTEVVLTLRGLHETVRLLLSANPNQPRVQYLSENRKNPDVPPNFCMFLRKHLLGGRFIKAETTDYPERLLSLHFRVCDEMGDLSEKVLYCEALGRASNLILVDPEGRIMDSIHHIEPDEGALRPVMPGLLYRLPPLPAKADPTKVTDEELRVMLSAASREQPVGKWFSSAFFGLTPLLCRELSYACFGDTDALLSNLTEDRTDRLIFTFRRMMNGLCSDDTDGTLIQDAKTGKFIDYSPVPIRQYGTGCLTRSYTELSSLMGDFYAGRDHAERMERRGGALLKIISSADAKLSKKIALQEEELSAAEDRDRFLHFGDTLNAYLYMIPKGAKEISLPDPYDEEGRNITIPLDPKLSPAHNAQKYYREYAKKKNAAKVLAGILSEGKAERDYLESVLDMLARAEQETDLDAVTEELTQTGYVRRRAAKKKEKPRTFAPLQYRTSTGYTVYVGRSNLQNDQLSLRTAGRFDLWLHAQKVPGAHCIIDCSEGKPDGQTVTEACMIAAYNSKARHSAQVPVDYTLVKNLKKPGGAKPGFVIYHVYETAYVTPDEAAVKAMEVKN